MREISPPESSHAFDLSGLRSPDVTFWSVWESEKLVGCGALKELGVRSGEVKSMRTAVTRRGEGIGSRMLEYILEEAKRCGYDHLYLETGAQPEFASARTLYERYGFLYRGPFADYTDNPNSVFMVQRIEPSLSASK